jgi:hypothetical protein
MLSDDVFRSRLQATLADLAQWVRSIGDVADAKLVEGPGFCRLTVAPTAAGACPFEMILRADQRLDISIGHETYEERAMPPLALLLPLAEAMAEGRVIERRWRSAATGALGAIETIVSPRSGDGWRDHQRVMAEVLPNADGDDYVAEDRHFVPYRRA